MHSFYLPPGNLDLITISGPDAVKLLQGQLTCDVAAISDPGFARGALCNNKGRVLATFIIVRQDHAIHLVLNKGLGEVLIASLKKFLPFYKCELRELAAGESCFGIVGGIALENTGLVPAGALPANGECRALNDGWVCNLDETQQQYLMLSRNGALPAAGVATATIGEWLACGVRSGQFPFGVEDSEKYTPQELHLDRHGYVSFTKGCYTGQEIVARMHYRGKLKKLLYLLEAPAAPDAGREPFEIYDANDQLLGTTIKVLTHAAGIQAFAPLAAESENLLTRPVKNRAGLQFDLRVF